ncbi:MAG: DUF4381 family protein [Niastella sp.]|nr:DUF4381 family protein [Niastella sp.]
MDQSKYLCRGICLALLVFISVANSYGQSVKTNVDRKQILIGERINYDIRFSFPTKEYQVNFNLPDSLLHFDILNKKRYDSVDGKGNFLIIQKILLTSFDSGQWSIPSFPINIRKINSASSYTLNTDPILINVGYSPEDSTGNLRDIKPIIGVKLIDYSWWYIAAAIAFGLLLLWLVYRYIKKRKKKVKPLFDSPLTAYEEAMQQLQLLDKNTLGSNEEIKQYHVSLSDILKRYLSRLLQKNLLNHTTGDILLIHNQIATDKEMLSELAGILRTNDAVKFAKYIPPKYESEKTKEQLKNILTSIEKHFKNLKTTTS